MAANQTSITGPKRRPTLAVPRIAHVTNDFDVSYALVAAGAGVGLVPELAGPPPPGVVLRPVAGAPPTRRIYVAVRAGSAERPAVAAMLAALTAR